LIDGAKVYWGGKKMLNIIKNRRSVRSFKAEQITDGELDCILEAACCSPSGHNAQPWFFTVIQNKEFIDYISLKTKLVMTGSGNEKARRLGTSENYHVLHAAPTVIIVSGKTEKSVIDLPGYEFSSYSPLADCSAAIQNMLLAAESIGIGSCWVGFVNYFFALPEEAAKLKVPDNYRPLFAVCLGYKRNETAMPLPVRKTDCVKYIR
jgi:nitroreductase